jgi:uncharacterized membrane protein YphA (DoxX/SURF4 family)
MNKIIRAIGFWTTFTAASLLLTFAVLWFLPPWRP